MGLITLPFTLTNGTTADATEVMADLTTIYSEFNGNINYENIATSGVRYSNLYSDVTSRICPIGSIIPFYDFNGGLTFDTNYWAYCDGSTKTIAGIGAQTMPDLSGRYLVGFGTDGGANIATDPWATVVVGNVANQVDLSHTHSVSHSHTLSAHTHDMNSHTHNLNSHTHTLNGHVHSGPSHTHDYGTLRFEVMRINLSGGYNTQFFNSSGTPVTVWTDDTFGAGGSVSYISDIKVGASSYYTANASGSTGSAGTGNTGSNSDNTSGPSVSTTAGPGIANTLGPSTPSTSTENPTSGSALSATQSIQPRSIRCRYIMRIA